MDFRIEKNVPLPDRTGDTKYPWASMTESGDSVLIPFGARTPEAAQRRFSNNARAWLTANRPGWKVVTKREEKGIRVWLVSPQPVKLEKKKKAASGDPFKK